MGGLTGFGGFFSVVAMMSQSRINLKKYIVFKS